MSESRVSASKIKYLTALCVVVLLAAAAVQGYFLFRMHGQLQQALAQKAEPGDSDAIDVPLSAPPGGNPLPQTDEEDDWNKLFGTPFDPNSWDPFKEMADMQKRMDQIFDNAFGRFHGSTRFKGLTQDILFNPKVDISEEGDSYVVRVDLPGVDQATVNVTLENGTLTLRGTREENVTQGDKKNVFRQERRIGQFQRDIPLPGPVDEDSMTTEYENGVLVIRVKKA